MKKVNIKEHVRLLNINKTGKLFIEGSMNDNKSNKPDSFDLKIESQTAQYKFDKLIKQLIQCI